MPMKDRKTLKKLFRKGSVPTEAGFSDLIDSNINKIDDGLSKSVDSGLMLAPVGNSNKVLSIYDQISEQDPEWSLELDKGEKDKKDKNLQLTHQDLENPVLNINDKGHVGINTDTANHPLEVNGIMTSKGRAGIYNAQSEIAADGQWYTIIDGLNHCNTFEITARVGVHKTGKHALLHAIAMSAYGNSHSKIKATHARFSFWRPIKIKLRWVGSTYNYSLQMRSSRDLGAGVNIKYYITQLWNDYEMGIPKQFLDPKEQ